MKSSDSYPRALKAPSGKVVIMDMDLFRKAISASRESPRKRVILPFHKSAADPLHRMFNAMQPWSYVRPHRHFDPPKAESVIVLQGRIGYILFDRRGGIEAYYETTADSPQFGIDTEPGVYHTFFALAEDTLLFEVKPGPYDPASDKDFAEWAPEEGSGDAVDYLGKLYELAKKYGASA
jgi:cupin fold WbuC family metalloprotein